jgi:hypothetical protein
VPFPSVLFSIFPSLSFALVPSFCKQHKQSLRHIKQWSMNGKFISYHYNTVIGLGLPSKWVSRFGAPPPIVTSLFPNIGQCVKIVVLPHRYRLLSLRLAPKCLHHTMYRARCDVTSCMGRPINTGFLNL